MENIEYVRPQDIEKRSFAIISQELEEKGIVLPKEQELVTKRAIHTSADFDYAKTMTYSDHAVEIAKRLIQNGADIVTDTNMALAGVNKKELAKYGGEAHCFMAEEEATIQVYKADGKDCKRARRHKGNCEYGESSADRKTSDLCHRQCTDSIDRII